MLTERIEVLLNRNLAASPRARELCAQLAGRRFAVHLRSTPWSLAMESTGDALLLTSKAGHNEPADASVSGTPLSLLALAGSAPETVIQRGAVTIEGDAELAQKFRELALLLRPDVEEELSRFIGDTPSHRLAGFARGVLGWARRSGDTAVRNVAEYLAHERGDLVPRAEAESFYGGVERLREDVDRLAARVERLQQLTTNREADRS